MRRIAFHAPLKSPDHPVPSGDRLMARQLMDCLARGGHDVTPVSDLRSFLRDPGDAATRDAILARAEAARRDLAAAWRKDGAPDLWMCYHPYYKSPDLLGPPLCAAFGVPYVTVEASYSPRRSVGLWRDWQARAVAGIRQAALNICLTRRDRDGLAGIVAPERLGWLGPFIDAAPFLASETRPAPGRLGVVAMMRPGDKLESYARLAAALALLEDADWRLEGIGDGPARGQGADLFARFGERIDWAGAVAREDLPARLARFWAHAWPGVGEAYGLAYLEAQACGVPVVAEARAGVPEVVTDGVTGLLTAEGDTGAYAAALRRVLEDGALRDLLGRAARGTVAREHDMAGAAARLNGLLAPLLEGRR
ncbi:glycosyltransferase family 4 protein [Oceaniglobus roseus]|uniref:glycosyltransferase family 4 protein n=1 Tax=Oceaniglobus roseus TaxID=1737570 RepID=UPI000C7F7901|nr:glycosyltransferase family 4 protein [Kandeliimicrobium roseum]